MNQKPDPSSIATLAGRELDAAIAIHLLGWRDVKWRPYGPPELNILELDGYPPDDVARDMMLRPDEIVDVPQSSSSYCDLEAMVRKVREAGWKVRHIAECDDGTWLVIIENEAKRPPGWFGPGDTSEWESLGRGSTLPLAFASAALMTCCEKTTEADHAE